MNSTPLKYLSSRLPILGIVSFVALYLYASTLYPGGSQADSTSIGFDWINNYWCNLLNVNAINGEFNPARPVAISGMVILCLSLMVFFIQFALTLSSSKFWKTVIISNGILSMGFATLIFTKHHDFMTILSSIFGLFVVIGMTREIYRSDLTIFKIGALVCMVLLALNNYIYYTEHGLSALPLLQKIMFFIVLLWIIGLSIKLIKKEVTQIPVTS